MDTSSPGSPHAGSAGPTAMESPAFASSGDAFIPEAMVRPGPRCRYFATNDRSKATTNHRRAHVNVNDETANGGESGGYVHSHRQVAQPAQTPREKFREPKHKARQYEENCPIKHQPEKCFLPIVKAIDGRKFLVFVANVMLDRPPPGDVGIGREHVVAPHLVHPESRRAEDQAKP